MCNKIISTFAILLIAFQAQAQIPSPGAVQSELIYLVGGVAHLGNGEVIENSAIGFENGKLTIVADARLVKLSKDATKINIHGKHVYPGLIATNTTIGLTEIDAVRATRDFREVGHMNPNIRTLIAYNTDSRVTTTIRSNGILLAQAVPHGGRISGLSSVMQLDAWNWEDAVVRQDDGIHMSWPSSITYKGWWAEPGGIEKNKEYDNQVTEIRDFFTEAKAYSNENSPAEQNIKFEAMRGVFSKSKNLYIRVHLEKEIIEAVNFCKEMGVNGVIVGGTQAWRVADFLAKNKVPVILGKTHRLPSREDDDIDIQFKAPKILSDAGVLFCISMGGGWEQRNLPFQAGSAAAHGLTQEEALQTITANAAKILGLDKTLGTLEPNKDATLIVSTGDVLDMRTSHIEMAFINGREVNLDNPQKMLDAEFRAKYGLEVK